MKIKYNLDLLKKKENLNVFSRFINGFTKEKEVIELIDRIKVVEEEPEKIEDPEPVADQPTEGAQIPGPTTQSVTNEAPETVKETSGDEIQDVDLENAPEDAKTEDAPDNAEDTGDQKIEGLDVTVEELEKEFEETISGKKADFVAFAKKYGIDLENATNNEARKLAITEWYNDKIN